MKFKKKNDYKQLKMKLFLRFVGACVIASAIVCILYKLIWNNKGGNWLTDMFQRFLKMDERGAVNLYQQIFRNNAKIIWVIAIIVIFLLLLLYVLNWFTKYFDMINQNIASILEEDAEIRLPTEMEIIERKLYEIKTQLQQRTLEARLAEQRKNELVMYLAHDIRTPLTSVIGYLSLLAEAPDMPAEQKAKYVDITLDKAYRLEKMINEFFEITRYNLQQISIAKEKIDLYYMLVQLLDELSPVLSANGNTTVLSADESLTVSGDPDKLARAFNNILKNAASYSFPDTEIVISAKETDDTVMVSFANQGAAIPKEKLSSLFEKFYRLDESRTSNTGGAGLGLAIAKEIITLHGGTITAESESNRIIFTVIIPKGK